MLRVCFATEDFYPDFIGGQGIYGKELVTKLTQNNIHVTVLAEKKRGRKEFWRSGTTFARGPLAKADEKLQIILVPFCFGQQIILAFLEYLYFILRCRNHQYDILHANQLSGLFFTLFKPKNIKKIILSAHHTNIDMYQVTESKMKRLLYLPLIFIENIMYRRADGVVCNSKSERKAIVSHFQIPESNTAVAYLGKPEISFTKKEKIKYRQIIRKKLSISSDEIMVLYVGRLVYKKRVHNLIYALKTLRREGIKVKGIIIGTGEMKTFLKKIAGNSAQILGFIPDTQPYFLASDIFVTTGVAEGGAALSVLEAAHFGLPLILSPDDADVPILKDGINGYLADPDNPTDIAQKIKKVIPSVKKFIAASKKISQQFSWTRCTSETLKFYKSILNHTTV